MVTTRGRRGALASPPLGKRPYFDASTAGPFTLNKTDPKVSVNKARVDRLGLHVSLTIPLESSVTPRAATNVKSKPARKEANEIEVPSSPPSPTRERHNATLLEANADKAIHPASRRISRSPGKQVAPASVRRKRCSRIRDDASAVPREKSTSDETSSSGLQCKFPERLGNHDGTLSTTNNTPEKSDHSEAASRCPASGSCPGHSKGGKQLKNSSTALSPAMSQETRNAGRELHRLPSSMQQLPCSGALDASIACKGASKQSCSDKLTLLKEGARATRNPSTEGIFSGDTGERRTGITTTASSYFWLLNSSKSLFSRKKTLGIYDEHLARFLPSFKLTTTSVAARRAAYALLGASWLASLLWMGLNPLNAASWAGLYRSNPPAPPSAQEWQEAAGAFFIPDAFENQSHCSALGSTCRRGEDLLCGFLVDSPSNECVALGQDVAAKRNGGSIDYALTSGGVSHGALLLSHLLQNVASFAMPELRYADPPISPPLSAASNTAATRLLQSYYPLYNHTNDPGVLISDSNATYAIHDNHGQVTIALAHGSPVFAVAMETATTDPEGRCESVEIRWFSVYVQLEGEENTACRKALPSQDTLTKMADGDEHWCRVGRFEYRCQRKGSLQVFCLQRPSGEREEPPPWASKGSVACRNGKAWQTQRVRIVLNGNWGAGATRIRRLRVLAFPESPYFYKE